MGWGVKLSPCINLMKKQLDLFSQLIKEAKDLPQQVSFKSKKRKAGRPKGSKNKVKVKQVLQVAKTPPAIPKVFTKPEQEPKANLDPVIEFSVPSREGVVINGMLLQGFVKVRQSLANEITRMCQQYENHKIYAQTGIEHKTIVLPTFSGKE